MCSIVMVMYWFYIKRIIGVIFKTNSKYLFINIYGIINILNKIIMCLSMFFESIVLKLNALPRYYFCRVVNNSTMYEINAYTCFGEMHISMQKSVLFITSSLHVSNHVQYIRNINCNNIRVLDPLCHFITWIMRACVYVAGGGRLSRSLLTIENSIETYFDRTQ